MVQHKTKSRVTVKCPECKNAFIPSLEKVQSRAGASSRRKGANFERKLAKELKKWWPGDCDFKRTPMSGGSALKDGFDMAGDICTNAPDFPYHIEAKNAPGSFTGLHNFFSEKSVVWKWLKQASDDCPDNKTPMLIFNRFDMPTFCAIVVGNNDNFIRERCERSDIDHIEFTSLIHNMCVCIWQYKDMISSNPENWK